MTVIQTRSQPYTEKAQAGPAPQADAHGHPDFLAHHFDTPSQQFEAAKLGMWLFLATEVLLFGGLFCLYAVYRGNHPEMFAYGSQFLDTRWGAANTAILLLSSMTMAIAVTAAQRGQKRLLIALLLATFMGGAMFMGVKYIEYTHKFHQKLYWGESFYEKPGWLIAQEQFEHWEAEQAAAAAPAFEPDAESGAKLWMATCRSCHGVAGEGVPGQGIDQRGSEFIASKSDAELVDFIKQGRPPNDPESQTGMQMPPSGGNPLLSDEELFHIVAYVRTFEPPPPGQGDPAAQSLEQVVADRPVEITRSVVPEAQQGPGGLNVPVFEQEERERVLVRDAPIVEHVDHVDHAEVKEFPHHTVDDRRPADAHLFFGLYFLMTGLHGIHVLVGMAIIAWLAAGAIRGKFGPQYFTPVDLGGLYWHVVDIIWIFLFPLLYLIT